MEFHSPTNIAKRAKVKILVAAATSRGGNVPRQVKRWRKGGEYKMHCYFNREASAFGEKKC